MRHTPHRDPRRTGTSIATTILLVLATIAIAATPLTAEDKLRIAVIDFDTQALRANWRYGWSYANLSVAAADNLASELVKSGHFRVIERQALDAVLSEQNMGESGRIDASSAARMGKVLGAQLIVIGSVTEYGIDEKSAKIPQIGKWKWGRGVGGSLVTGKSSLTARLVDTTTGEILGAYEGHGKHKFGKGEFAGARAGTTWDSGTASKVLAEAIEQLAQDIAGGAADLKPATVRGGLEAKVARVDGDKIYLNIGSGSGVKPGDRFEIRGMGEVILDPDTGEVLGGEESVLGTVEIDKVLGDRLSTSRTVGGSGFSVGDRAVMK